MGELELMFTDLIKSETRTVRGRDFTFYEISALDWVEHLVAEESSGGEGVKELASRNRDFSVRVIATSLAPGVEQSVKELIEEMVPLSNELIGELFDGADSVNGITQQLSAVEGKGSRGGDTLAA